MRTALAGPEIGQLLLVLVLVVRTPGIQGGPARLDDPNAPRPERDLVRLAVDQRDVLHTGGIEHRDQARHDGVVDLLCPGRQGSGVFPGRDDRMMVAHLPVVDDLTCEDESVEIELADIVGLDWLESRGSTGLPVSCHCSGSVSRSADS